MTDFTFTTNQHGKVYMVSDNHPNQYFKFVNDILLKILTTESIADVLSG